MHIDRISTKCSFGTYRTPREVHATRASGKTMKKRSVLHAATDAIARACINSRFEIEVERNSGLDEDALVVIHATVSNRSRGVPLGRIRRQSESDSGSTVHFL